MCRRKQQFRHRYKNMINKSKIRSEQNACSHASVTQWFHGVHLHNDWTPLRGPTHSLMQSATLTTRRSVCRARVSSYVSNFLVPFLCLSVSGKVWIYPLSSSLVMNTWNIYRYRTSKRSLQQNKETMTTFNDLRSRLVAYFVDRILKSIT